MAKASKIARNKWLELPCIGGREDVEKAGYEYSRAAANSILFFDYKKWREFDRVCVEIYLMAEYFDSCIELNISYAPLLLRGVQASPIKVFGEVGHQAENDLYTPVLRCDFAEEYIGKKMRAATNYAFVYPACFFSAHDPNLCDGQRQSPIITKLHRDGI